MAASDRLRTIEVMVNEHGFVSVRDLSLACNVSEMTIRRDLQQLEEDSLLKRTYGGAVSLHPAENHPDGAEPDLRFASPDYGLTNRVDVIIATALEKHYDALLQDRANKKNLPIVAESAPLEKEVALVALDNSLAAQTLGKRVGEESRRRWGEQIYILDLTYRMPNTRVRSQAFLKGLQQECPQADLVLSIDAQSSRESSYQITRDALTVHPQINVIFAINDATAGGALRACEELEIDPQKITIVTFGLEGDAMLDALAEGSYCRIALAMFPEIVGPTCIEAAVMAFNRQPLPPDLVTPFAILTTENLREVYTQNGSSWNLNWDYIEKTFALPLEIHPPKNREEISLPKRIGFVIPFSRHDWYHSLVRVMKAHAEAYGMELEVVDTEKDMYDELDNRRKAIALLASEQVQPGEVVIVDSGPIAEYLARDLVGKKDLTVITNSTKVFGVLNLDSGVTLISTGGVLRRASQVLVGSTAESSLADLRADKLFLSATGLSLEFGLSHSNYSEVSMKQAMIRSAKEVILLADFSTIGQESIAQVCDLSCIQRVIADDSLPATLRLELTKKGIKLLLASS